VAWTGTVGPQALTDRRHCRPASTYGTVDAKYMKDDVVIR